MVVVTRYADVLAVLRDGRFSRRPALGEETPPAGFSELSMMDIDPPQHTRLRRMAGKVVNRRFAKRVREQVIGIVDEHLANLHGERIDLVTDFALPLSYEIVFRLVGVPAVDRHALATQMRAINNNVETFQTAIAGRRSDSVKSYIRALAQDHRRRPADNIISELLGVYIGNDQMTEDELVATVFLLFAAGPETMVGLLGNAMLALLTNRDQLTLWRANPSIRSNAIDELIRFDGPAQYVARTAIDDVELPSGTVLGGSAVLAVLAAAARDPYQFHGPDRLRLDRSNAARHVGFGSGPHLCLGADLARMQAEIALGRLIGERSDISLDGEPSRNSQMTQRRLDSLPVRFGR